MTLKLRSTPFKRNRSREKNLGDVFHKTSTRLNWALTILFSPVLMAPSLFSQEIVLMFISISLCLGNLANLGYRIYQNDVSKTELFLTLTILPLFITAAYSLLPSALSIVSLLGAIALTNQLAIGVNSFFLLRNSIIPPILGWFKHIARQLGFEIHDQYYQNKPFDLQADACIVNSLYHKHFDHNLYEGPVEEDLKKLNQLLQILTDYINKYDEKIFGYMHYQQAINAVEGYISQLTVHGNADSSFAFIKQKLIYKEVKLHKLNQAKSVLSEENNHNWEHFKKYCEGVNKARYNKTPTLFHQQASELFDKEIQRQQAKMNRLSNCLP